MTEHTFKRFSKKEGNKFLAYIRNKGQFYATWEYKESCFLIWSNGLMSKQEGETQFAYIEGRGWVKY
jgi:hypothetical protein